MNNVTKHKIWASALVVVVSIVLLVALLLPSEYTVRFESDDNTASSIQSLAEVAERPVHVCVQGGSLWVEGQRIVFELNDSTTFCGLYRAGNGSVQARDVVINQPSPESGKK